MQSSSAQDSPNSHQAEIPVSIASLHNACPEMAQQLGNGAIAVTVLICVTMLIRSLTDLVKAKS